MDGLRDNSGRQVELAMDMRVSTYLLVSIGKKAVIIRLLPRKNPYSELNENLELSQKNSAYLQNPQLGATSRDDYPYWTNRAAKQALSGLHRSRRQGKRQRVMKTQWVCITQITQHKFCKHLA